MSFNDNDSLWDDDEQAAFDRETRSIGGFSMDVDMPAASRESIYDTVDEMLAKIGRAHV